MSANNSHNNTSAGDCGSRPAATTVTSGTGRAARSTFPFTDNGSPSDITTTTGTM
ncbi:hypothetical protein [Streptomyces sp. NPDC047123]|uniref:hypothetical protein n=1 Tax=Streptomyces sp. NPDC047123 TaxID=3155622 RepID=UPI0033E74A0D